MTLRGWRQIWERRRAGSARETMSARIRGSSTSMSCWSRYFSRGNDFNQVGHSIQQTEDGGYIVAGYTTRLSTKVSDAYIIKTDKTGQEQWSHAFSGKGTGTVGVSVRQTVDWGYIVCGHRYPARRETDLNYDGSTIFLTKLARTGVEKWTRTFKGPSINLCHAARQTKDGGYIITGSCGVERFKDSLLLIKTDAAGHERWRRIFTGRGTAQGLSVEQTTDGGYIVVGRTSPSTLDSRVYLIKTDDEGRESWSRVFGYNNENAGHSVQQTQDGGYIMTGFTSTFGGESDIYLAKTDEDGQEQWNTTFGWGNNNVGHAVRQSRDGGYIVAGSAGGLSSGVTRMYLVKTDEAGRSEWSRTFEGKGEAVGRDVQQTDDNGYVVVGFTIPYWEKDATDIYVVKADAEGVGGPRDSGASARHVFGGGSIDSRPGAFVTNPRSSGKATFVFVSAYKRGDSLPSGQTHFLLPSANLEFRSDSYTWLTVTGGTAQYSGTGFLNGEKGYCFITTAFAGRAHGGNDVDRYRMKIWRPGGDIVYDNVPGASDDIETGKLQALTGGSVIIPTA